ncbi:MAG: extracellular solute-binding protein [Clostridia bacterium]|nr:extracellular solute-binding protein [Clostridia bacterium]
MKRLLAVLLMLTLAFSMLAGCGKKETAELEDPNTVPKDTYEIQWYLMADAQNDVASVEEALNEYLKDKINATVKINCLPSAQYTKKLGTMINAGEYFDLCFAARWALDYVGNSRSGAFYDLTDHLDTYLKDINEIIGEETMKCSYVDGRLYGLPVYKEMATQQGWIYRKDIAEKYDIDMSKYKSFKELEPVLKMIKEKEPDMKYPIDWAYGAGEPASLVMTANNIFVDGSYDNQPVNRYATKEYKEACEIARDFYNKGYVRPDVLTATDQVARMSEGKTFVMLQPLKPGKALELFKNSKYEFEQVGITEPGIDHLAGTGSMQVVSATSKNPARVMRFLNLLNTDPYVKNLVVHGVEGKHYKKIDDKTVEPIKGSGYSLYTNSWAIGNVFLDYLLPEDDPTKHEQLQKFNEEAKKPLVATFLLKEVTDPDKKQRNIEINNTVENYAKQLNLGAVDVEPNLKEFLEVLDKAGIDSQLKDIKAEWKEFQKNN